MAGDSDRRPPTLVRVRPVLRAARRLSHDVHVFPVWPVRVAEPGPKGRADVCLRSLAAARRAVRADGVPVVTYPIYRVTAVDPSWSAFWQHWLALPIWPSGPQWFL